LQNIKPELLITALDCGEIYLHLVIWSGLKANKLFFSRFGSYFLDVVLEDSYSAVISHLAYFPYEDGGWNPAWQCAGDPFVQIFLVRIKLAGTLRIWLSLR
jgi:hypothetical protein